MKMLGRSEFALRKFSAAKRLRIFRAFGARGGAVEICRILGRDETLRRLKLGLGKL